MKTWKILGIFLPFIFVCLLTAESMADSDAWQKLDDGLYLGEFDPQKKSEIYQCKIIVLKFDPKVYSFHLLTATEHDRKPRTAKQWCREFGLRASINASMYLSIDLLKSTGYMKNYKHVNNSHINPAFGAFIAFNPKDSFLPELQIIDRRLHRNWKDLIKKYNTVVQNYRMISKGKKRGWPQQEQMYSIAAIGTDRKNNVLFIHSQSPYSTHDFIHILLSIPIHIENAVYLEGGPEATLYYTIEGKELTVFEGCNIENAGYDTRAWGSRIPNVIGVKQRFRIKPQ